jgi:Ala-tRNA(Pro) deacylase
LNSSSEPAGATELFDLLERLGVEFTTLRHPPVFTVEEAKRLRGEIVGAHTKNLLLRNKKAELWLVTCLEDREIDFKELAGKLGTKHLTFASPGRLADALGVIPGAVTPLALINDRYGRVRLVMDEALQTAVRLNFHPLDNNMTTSLTPEGFGTFLTATGHQPIWLGFDDTNRIRKAG